MDHTGVKEKELNTSKTNAEYQREWYYRQKNNGIVYLLTIDGETYIGSTTNCLTKRLQQHKAGAYIGGLLAAAKEISIKEIDKANKPSELKTLEQKWIEELKPTLNTNAALYKNKRKHSYKGGVTINGEWFPTKLAAWEKYGKTPLGTFKSRWNRTRDLNYCLGTIEQKGESSV